MYAQILDGSKAAKDLTAEIAAKAARYQRKPKLSVILVGDDPASKVYVGMKERALASVGFISETHRRAAGLPENELLALIDSLNADMTVDAVLCQLPLPKHIDANKVISRILPSKDVDCFHPLNAGYFNAGIPQVTPCTPAGVMELLRRYEIPILGRNAVVVGHSNIVGKPLAQMLISAGATVTVCHIHTRDVSAACKTADILCVAVGKPEFIRGNWVKDGAVVIDIGINRVGGERRIVGDVCFDEVSRYAGYITPVPGGVGPMTIAMLVKNTFELFRAREEAVVRSVTEHIA